jgi:hypothetical protein
MIERLRIGPWRGATAQDTLDGIVDGHPVGVAAVGQHDDRDESTHSFAYTGDPSNHAS